MAIYIIRHVFNSGVDTLTILWPYLKWLPLILAIWLIKVWSSGATNKSERKMNGKVVLVTGGISGVGQAVVRDLAERGAHIVLLTQRPLSEVVEHIEDLRRETKNHLITAEQVDLSSLHSIRTFATKWIDNVPPRRLDMVILCATTSTFGNKVDSTMEGVETNWQVNYLANFHLMSILSPALRAQPPDRDVRVLFGMCSSHLGGDLLHVTDKTPDTKGNKAFKNQSTSPPTKFSPNNAFATSKLALLTFGLAFQKHLAAYKRPDDFPMNTKVIFVDPGFCRTPGMRRWVSQGSLLGLLLYLLTYPFWWLLLKSPEMGAQTFMYAAMEERFNRGQGGWLLKECKERKIQRADALDEADQQKLWQHSERVVEEAEKRGATLRAKAKQETDDQKDEDIAAKEIQDYKDSIGKKDGRKDGSRRTRKHG